MAWAQTSPIDFKSEFRTRDGEFRTQVPGPGEARLRLRCTVELLELDHAVRPGVR